MPTLRYIYTLKGRDAPRRVGEMGEFSGAYLAILPKITSRYDSI
ncbi:hypothetical protein MC7420_3572 [Coleofasciculus chthonoplastes PCC 7420]|uniref:Uncharacterized protein n=1 Tax=Coleofasciculus chthonoplastes PCC 7420 TaxID=118168 RepID=B4W073_9CYAN|nr:hypothetical protein MC7420_3572 [Coleofasciculus chthonoplastes PCC 7420]